MSLETPTPAQTVSLRGVQRTFPTARGSHVVLDQVDLDIVAGEIVAIIGPSGCGKSTLLRQVSGLDHPDHGDIFIADTPVTGVDSRTAFAFQEPRLLPWRTVSHNVALGLPRRTPRSEREERVATLLGLVGLTDAAALRPEIEEIALTDSRLRQNWGERVWRLLLHDIAPQAAARREFIIRRTNHA
jgi:sulfonate transport system ATP-binding protein